MDDNGRSKGSRLMRVVGVVVACALCMLLVLAFNRIREGAEQTKALSNIKQIAFACRVYAIDHDGEFPNSSPESEQDRSRFYGTELAHNSGGAWDLLIDGDYCPSETVSWRASERLCTSRPDDDFGEDRKTYLGNHPEQNAWSYVSGLSDADASHLPLVLSRLDSEPWGELWDGRVIVVSLDYAGRVGKVEDGGELPSSDGLLDNLVDLSDPANRYPERAEILDPTGPRP